MALLTAYFKGLEKGQEKEQDQLRHSIEKAKEDRDHERLKKLEAKKKSTSKASVWASGIEKNRGPIENRSCVALSVGEIPSKEGWDKIQSVARISRERTVNNVPSHETIYYISSLQPNAQIIAEVASDHLGAGGQLRLET